MLDLRDIIALLEQWPRWKDLTALPARVQALEARLAAIAGLLCCGLAQMRRE